MQTHEGEPTQEKKRHYSPREGLSRITHTAASFTTTGTSFFLANKAQESFASGDRITGSAFLVGAIIGFIGSVANGIGADVAISERDNIIASQAQRIQNMSGRRIPRSPQ